ncbi:MAG: hypothetical protein JNL66_20425 [Alphaproteobacteria bacterium]|nr:hypothetical protein [Alphaproteobacteria bacterium]
MIARAAGESHALLRLECLKLAVAHGSTLDRFDPIAKAESYFAFVIADSRPREAAQDDRGSRAQARSR